MRTTLVLLLISAILLGNFALFYFLGIPKLFQQLLENHRKKTKYGVKQEWIEMQTDVHKQAKARRRKEEKRATQHAINTATAAVDAKALHPPRAATMPPTNPPADHELFLVLVTVIGIIFLQILLAVAYLAYRNYAEKAKWRRLSRRGVVVINGPAIFWTDDLPVPSVPVRFDVADEERVTRGLESGRAGGVQGPSSVEG
ncbi:hypothetical protein OPT61_g3506 [Boeremia exigua]|uniref:Uncharacterized protein n=1 Tax=Boeremia exigua TaxID=749465 RepID=A0ACC2IHN7_9PLEO|nr:hypothetical protein OPT61_g3506 [Boeremia exigua]